MRVIIYIGNFKLSSMDAESQRVLGNCKILQELNYQPVLIGNDEYLAKEDPLSSELSVEGFTCYNIKCYMSIKGLIRSKNFHKSVMRIINNYQDIYGVVCYGTPAFAIEIKFLSDWCKQRRIPLMFDCVDLSSTAHGKLIERIVKALDRKYRDFLICKNANGIIAVSQYIADHYRKRTHAPYIIIPPLRDTHIIPAPVFDKHTTKRIVYYGIPFPVDGRNVNISAYKDRIDLMIDLLSSVREQATPFYLDLYGLTKKQYLHVVSRHRELLEENADHICFHGRVSHDEVSRVVSQADYTVVYRVRNRMTMAGFSTKLSESICLGTPVLFTDTSDYIQYLQLDTMGCLLDEDLTDNNREKILKALAKPAEDMIRMKRACYEARLFDYRKYVGCMSDFIVQVTKGERQSHV